MLRGAVKTSAELTWSLGRPGTPDNIVAAYPAMNAEQPIPDGDGKHFAAVAAAMQEYSLRMAFELERRRRAIALLPSRHAGLLPRTLVQTKIRALEASILKNQMFLDGVLRSNGLPGSRDSIPPDQLRQLSRWPAIPPLREPTAPYRDHSKLLSTFH